MKPADSMDDETLIKHVNARHVPIAGLAKVKSDAGTRGPGEKLLRQYHHHVHFRGYDDNDPAKLVNHTHAD